MPLLISFAEQATLALELGEKNRAQRQLDVFADRDRIARDLHDHVIQRLFATGLQLQSTLRRSTDPAVQRRIRQAVEELDETVREIRTAIFDLHTTGDGAHGGLRRQLLDTAAEAAAGSGVSPSVRMSGAVDTLVAPEIGAHAVAVVREAVSNAVRHGGRHRGDRHGGGDRRPADRRGRRRDRHRPVGGAQRAAEPRGTGAGVRAAS